MNEETAFIAALVAEPSDRTAALVFADWLDERGDPRGPMMRNDEVRAWMAPTYADPRPGLAKALETGKKVTQASKVLALIGEASVPTLLALFAHETTSVRLRALNVLRLMSSRAGAALPALLALVKDKNYEVRGAALAAATEIVKHGTVDTAPLREALHDPDRDVRSWASSLLGKMRATGDVKKELAKGLDSEDADARLAALAAMSNLHTTAGAGELCNALSDPSVEVRRAAAEQLYRMADARTTKWVEPLHKALSDADAGVKWSAAAALGKIGPAAAVALPDLLRLLSASDDKERSRLVSAVGRTGVDSPDALEAVLAALRDPNESVRSAAVVALTKWTALPPSAAPALLKFVRDIDSKYTYWRGNSGDGLRALARIVPQQPDVLDEFRTRLTGTYAGTVAAILGELGPAAAPLLPELIAAFRPGSVSLRDIALALGKIGGDGITALVSALGTEPVTGYNSLSEAALVGLNAAGPAAIAALPALLARLREPLSPSAQAEVLRAVAKMGPGAASTVPDLMALFLSEHVQDPYNAFPNALESFGPAVVPFVPQLVELLRQPARAQRHPGAIRLLTSLIPHGADVLAALSDALRRANAGDQYAGESDIRFGVAQAAIEGLEALGPVAEAALPELAVAYGTFDGPPVGDAREAVLAAYGAIGDDVVPTIREALTDSNWRIRSAAVAALGATGDTSAETVDALRALETDASKKVRARAVAVLKKMEAPKKKRK